LRADSRTLKNDVAKRRGRADGAVAITQRKAHGALNVKILGNQRRRVRLNENHGDAPIHAEAGGGQHAPVKVVAFPRKLLPRKNA
jgi:hypothetical protein